MWDSLRSIHLQKHPSTRFNAYDDLFNIRKTEDESLQSLINRVEDRMKKIKDLRPDGFDLCSLDEELASIIVVGEQLTCQPPPLHSTPTLKHQNHRNRWSLVHGATNLVMKKLSVTERTEIANEHKTTLSSTPNVALTMPTKSRRTLKFLKQLKDLPKSLSLLEMQVLVPNPYFSLHHSSSMLTSTGLQTQASHLI